jgi:hypothetical protein
MRTHLAAAVLAALTMACATPRLEKLTPAGHGAVSYGRYAPRPTFVPIEAPVAPAVLDSLWSYVQSCSGIAASDSVTGRGIKWFRAALYEYRPGLLGGWFAPDTVVLDDRVVEGVDTLLDGIAHEMLHHLMRGPGQPGDTMDQAHPFQPFHYPCHLMYWQNHRRPRWF